MQKAVINLIMASVIIFSAFAIGCAVKTACNSKIKTDALFACRVFYVSGLIIGLKSLMILFNQFFAFYGWHYAFYNASYKAQKMLLVK